MNLKIVHEYENIFKMFTKQKNCHQFEYVPKFQKIFRNFKNVLKCEMEKGHEYKKLMQKKEEKKENWQREKKKKKKQNGTFATPIGSSYDRLNSASGVLRLLDRLCGMHGI